MVDLAHLVQENGLGGILADDMGLGKTVQLLSRILADHPAPTLVVCPTTLLENWRREAARFAPSSKSRSTMARRVNSPTAWMPTSCSPPMPYWSGIRNCGRSSGIGSSSTRRRRSRTPRRSRLQAARALKAPHRFAVTGTPVENHLGDLWSLMAFAQPGLLGSFAGFRRRYLSAEGRADDRRVERLRMVVSPFLLRRSKRDRTVVPDLPDKIEVRRDCALSREQVGVYEAVVRRLEEEAKSADGTKRRGVILAGLTRLKQACVHPQLALGTHQRDWTSPAARSRSCWRSSRRRSTRGRAVGLQSVRHVPAPLADLLTQRGAPPPCGWKDR